MTIQKYDNGDIDRIGLFADNVPEAIIDWVRGTDADPTMFAIEPGTGRIFAYVDKAHGKRWNGDLGVLPTLGEEHRYIIEHGQDVTDCIKELVAVSEFHSRERDKS